MAIAHDFPVRSTSHAPAATCLEDRFEILRDIGDGSFGTVVLARVRTAGANIARRGSVVCQAHRLPWNLLIKYQIAIKTMKKTFDSFAPCLELREVIFLRSLPNHAHLVPALDIFLDPMSRKLHICMEYMDGNLYQLMKARDHKCMDGSTVKSILYQCLSGLDHIHGHNFFHRDIKPENILISTTASMEPSNTFKRYSSLATPPSTPAMYTVKIADFGLARETHSQHPYTTYVSTRWYRAPEVLLRAGEYSAPVDIWALGAMAVEVANLKPLFPGSNEVDQVWRVCEIMGSPGNWCGRSGKRVGGGEWKDGTKLAQKLGFSFPKMAPHSMETILRPPQWPAALANLVTWCLMWDPKARPTSAEALSHEYFADAIDPLRPKSSTPSSTMKFLSRKQSVPETAVKPTRESIESPPLSSKPSWFRKSLIRDQAPVASHPQEPVKTQLPSPRPSPVHANTIPVQSPDPVPAKSRPFANKRATWTNGTKASNAAPMPILPSIRPISPFSASVTAQANDRVPHGGATHDGGSSQETGSKKIGRQLSVASHGNHYPDYHRQEAERALNGQRDVVSPSGVSKEGFFSHLRKRARRLSGKPSAPVSPPTDDLEAQAGCGPWHSNRSSMIVDSGPLMDSVMKKDPTEVEKALQTMRYGAEGALNNVCGSQQRLNQTYAAPLPDRNLPLACASPHVKSNNTGAIPISTRTRRALQLSTHPSGRYEVPDEEDELLHDAMNKTKPVVRVDTRQRSPLQPKHQNSSPANPYPTPSSSAKGNGVMFWGQTEPVTPLQIDATRQKENSPAKYPTPPYESDWATATLQAIGSA